MEHEQEPLAGRTLANYRLEERLGEGGMGVVYRATDTRLQRSVAVKVLAPGSQDDPERQKRLLREARAASTLNHPGIVTIHEVNAAEGVSFIVMELVAGQPVSARIEHGPLPVDEALSYGAQLAAALAAAHEAGIVHRDVKPANMIVTRDGRLKVLDFGLARPISLGGSLDSEGQTRSATLLTQPGVLLGTPSYMSPEQAAGEPAGPPSDVFSAGIVLYEMITGRRPFARNTLVTTLAAILEQDAPRLTDSRPGTPPALADLVAECLRKEPGRRPSAQQLRERLEALRAPQRPLGAPTGPARRPWAAVSMAVLLALALGAAGWLWRRASRREWARAAVSDVRRLAGEGRSVAAFRLATDALDAAPDDAELRQELTNLSFEARIESDPPGAQVEYTDYAATLPWRSLGKTPIASVRIPLFERWRVTLAGHDAVESSGEDRGAEGTSLYRFRLEPQGSAPAGMVRVPAGSTREFGRRRRDVGEYWIDRYEVTNREYRAFVDAGGYAEARYWTEPFVKAGRAIPFAQAVTELVDSTGRPGPATWELGAPPEGQDDLPVGGVSFYEAAAYARYAGKQLPTGYHWARASGMDGLFSDILTVSHFDGKGPAARGAYHGVGPFGTYDMAGNVKEWVASASGDRRYILGGAWNEPPYTFRSLDALPPFERLPQHGFRCIKPVEPVPEALLAPVEPSVREYDKETPASDSVFAAYARHYAYDPAPLQARVEQVDDSNPNWRKETVSIAAAYGGERVPLYVFVPRQSRPPYQAVVFHPGGDSLQLTSSRDLWLPWIDFVVRSGRLVVYPVLKGTYERRVELRGASDWRDSVVQRAKDVARTVDYLEQREDVDASRLVYYGLSLGAQSGLVSAAMTPRFRTLVLAAGGLRQERPPPEIDVLNFAPRILAPTLMLNGRDDFNVPLETSQRPLFRLLGTPAAQKRHVLLDGGHIPPRMQDVVREVLNWLDEQLGVPEKARPSASGP